ncbi:MAG: hypothetical protein GOMPHAMPRED_001552 [Gomphillus americanus]|uniref:DUF7730 domain-containing protein n=1 Tax=Gomphillus americanus TaxID=1940652 RepID=A0A8H3F3C4_9LECA|nr:MAG: hypothetical protein GOMPHAMPRED_001552 [Gomphillus americanus]
MASTPSHAPENTSYFDVPACPSNIHDPHPPSPPFRFMDLPGEIQNDIVNKFIVSSRPVTIHLPRFNRRPSPAPALKTHPKFDKPVTITPPHSRNSSIERDRQYGHSRLALMLTCKKLYREHWRTYYGDNIFVFNMDIFREFAQSIPSRCWQHIRKIAFKMPHRHHHEGVWKMLTTMGSLNEIQLWLPDFVEVDETVREVGTQGIKDCKNLKSIEIKRLGEQDGEYAELTESDRELQDHFISLLDSKGDQKGTKKSSQPPKLQRRLTDPFALKQSDVEN